jgi:hypothetical protein
VAPGVTFYAARAVTGGVCVDPDTGPSGCFPTLGDPGTAEGLNIAVGLGYDVRAGRNLFVTPIVSYSYSDVQDIDAPEAPFVGGFGQSSRAQRVVELGLSLTYH